MDRPVGAAHFGKIKNAAKSVGSFVNRHKWDIGLTAVSFIPGLGVAAVAYRGYRGVRAAQSLRKAKAAAKCRRNSFVTGTHVLLADHTTIPIEQVKIGDLVLATDPTTGRTEAKPVTDLIQGSGLKTLIDITIEGDGEGGPGLLVATDEHPIYTSYGWVDAGELVRGNGLRTIAGKNVRVRAVSAKKIMATVYNLTVEGLRTYYVRVDGVFVLVHNCAKKARKPAKNADRKGHENNARGSTTDKHTQAQNHSGSRRIPDNPNKGQRPQDRK